MLIRDALPADLPAIVDIYNSTVASRMVTADTEPVSVESKQKWFAEHNPETRPLWVAEQDHQIIAWVSFQSFYGRPAYRHTAEISIYIHPNHRHKGLGVQLLEYSLSQCPRLEIKTLLGFIFGHNAPSIRLFEKFGFTPWGTFPRIAELDGIERDLIIFGKRVG
jgi:phosphinothricin acetyltransferase